MGCPLYFVADYLGVFTARVQVVVEQLVVLVKTELDGVIIRWRAYIQPPCHSGGMRISSS